MNFIIFILRIFVLLVCLPFAPGADDRIVALQLFQQARSRHWPWRVQRRWRFIHAWLNSAARRQQRLNAIHIPRNYQLQRRKWERKFSYQFAAKRWGFCWAVYYGTERLEPLLKQHSPSFYAFLNHAALSLIHFVETGITTLMG